MDVAVLPGRSLDESLGTPVDLRNAMRSGRFPQEIYDMVIDEVAALPKDSGSNGVHIPQEALVACMLTCKQFVGRSRQHLYRHLTIGPSRDVGRIECLYHPSRLGIYVRSLQIGHFPEYTSKGQNSSEHWLTHFVPMLSCLQNVSSLSLVELDWAKLGIRTRLFILRHFPPTVKDLKLEYVNLWNTNQGFRLLRSFPYLSTLTMGPDVTWRYPNHTQSQLTAHVPLDLDRLTILDTPDDDMAVTPWTVHLLQWFLVDRPVFRVRTIDLNWCHDDPRQLVALLLKILPSVEELRLRLEISGWKFKLWEGRPEHYDLEDDEISDGEVPGRNDTIKREQWRRQLETEAKNWGDNPTETWQILGSELAKSVGSDAPNLKRIFIDINVMPYDATEIIPLCHWLSSIARPGISLDFMMDMLDSGIEYLNLDEMGESMARCVETWRMSFSKVIFRINWPEYAGDPCKDEDMPWFPGSWLEWLRGQWPQLQKLGLPFEDGQVAVELSSSPSGPAMVIYREPPSGDR
ncbi:hypothetical protein OBBRIDRAFT_890829 [Obba rivulosa]|uniref:F-box domain-containing protein n=1 Tax=Obba rivulosa TaxID=1052685 RepID=A0A8E2AV50_9APHY|nr:hypothetical protein OBBRIDRAFT_890829 [Obba rivulosa]